MKLEIGKFYRTRDGRKAGPLRIASWGHFFYADIDGGLTYASTGKWTGSSNPDSSDLVAEWLPSDEPLGGACAHVADECDKCAEPLEVKMKQESAVERAGDPDESPVHRAVRLLNEVAKATRDLPPAERAQVEYAARRQQLNRAMENIKYVSFLGALTATFTDYLDDLTVSQLRELGYKVKREEPSWFRDKCDCWTFVSWREGK